MLIFIPRGNFDSQKMIAIVLEIEISKVESQMLII